MSTPNYQTTVKNTPLSILAACVVEELERMGAAATLLEFADTAEQAAVEQAAQTLLTMKR